MVFLCSFLRRHFAGKTVAAAVFFDLYASCPLAKMCWGSPSTHKKVKRLKQPEMITANGLKTWAESCVGGCTQANLGLATPFRRVNEEANSLFCPESGRPWAVDCCKRLSTKRRHTLAFRICTNSGESIYLTVLYEYKNLQERIVKLYRFHSISSTSFHVRICVLEYRLLSCLNNRFQDKFCQIHSLNKTSQMMSPEVDLNTKLPHMLWLPMQFGSRSASKPRILPPYICMCSLFYHSHRVGGHPVTCKTCTFLALQPKQIFKGQLISTCVTSFQIYCICKYFCFSCQIIQIRRWCFFLVFSVITASYFEMKFSSSHSS